MAIDHADAVGIHRAAYVGDTDPMLVSANKVAAGKLWIDTSNNNERVIKMRSYDNESWLPVGGISDFDFYLLLNSKIIAGSNITITPDATTRTLTLAAATGGVTLEEVDDRVAALIVNGQGITKNYDDAEGTLTLAVSSPTLADGEGAIYDSVSGGLRAIKLAYRPLDTSTRSVDFFHQVGVHVSATNDGKDAVHDISGDQTPNHYVATSPLISAVNGGYLEYTTPASGTEYSPAGNESRFGFMSESGFQSGNTTNNSGCFELTNSDLRARFGVTSLYRSFATPPPNAKCRIELTTSGELRWTVNGTVVATQPNVTAEMRVFASPVGNNATFRGIRYFVPGGATPLTRDDRTLAGSPVRIADNGKVQIEIAGVWKTVQFEP